MLVKTVNTTKRCHRTWDCGCYPLTPWKPQPRKNILWVSFGIYMKTPSARLVAETLATRDTQSELLGSCGEQARAIGQTWTPLNVSPIPSSYVSRTTQSAPFYYQQGYVHIGHQNFVKNFSIVFTSFDLHQNPLCFSSNTTQTCYSFI